MAGWWSRISRSGSGEAGADHAQCPAVGLVGAGPLVAVLGQCRQFVGDGDQSRRHRQLLLQRGQLGSVVAQRGVGRAAGGQPHHVGGDVRVAVTVAADPRAGPQDGFGEQVGVGPAAAQRLPDLGVDFRHHLEERGRVVPQPDRDLVGDLQPGQPNERGLPQGQHLAAQLGLDVTAVAGFGVPLRMQAHQLGDSVLGVEDGPAAGFGRMGGDDRGDQRAGQRLGDGRRVQVRCVELQVGGGQTAVLRRVARGDVDGAAPFPVNVLSDVGQQREVAERPDHRDGLVDVDAGEQSAPRRRARSPSGAPGRTPAGLVLLSRRPRRRSAHARCRRGWHRVAGCLRASARWPHALSGCAAPRRRAPASPMLQPYLPVLGRSAVFALRGLRRCI